MNKINEIGNTVKWQELLGKTAERAHQRAQRTSGADKQKHEKTEWDAYQTAAENSRKHLDGSGAHFARGRDAEYDEHWDDGRYPWSKKHKSKNESRNMNKKLIRLTEQDLHRIVKESVKRVLKESIYNGLQQEVEQIVRSMGQNIEEWLNDTCFVDQHGCDGYIFKNEEDAVNSILYGDDHQNAIDAVDGAQSDEEWVDYLIKCGIDKNVARAVISKQDWDSVVKMIVRKDGPEWFLSTYSGQVHNLSDGSLLYY